MPNHVIQTRRNHVIELRFDRPECKNALTSDMYETLARVITEAEQDDTISIITFSGSNDFFTAGNDLEDFQRSPPRARDAPVYKLMLAMVRSSKILIAGVNGVAVGIGTTMLLHCDLVVAARSARFILPFVEIGLVPEFASSRLLPSLMGRQRASAALLLGEPISASEAFAAGFVTKIVDDGAVAPAVVVMVEKLLAKPPTALARIKKLLAGDIAPVEALIAQEGALLADGVEGPEYAEAATAFFEKRAPVFRT